MTIEIFKGVQASAYVCADSVNTSTGKRIITFVCRYWRAIHSEVMTHRVFSRNGSSSRAIPVLKILSAIEEETAMPIQWGANQPGMQAHAECDALVYHPRTGEPLTREQAWAGAAADAVGWARSYNDAGYHKQIVNRLVEPYSFITVVITATSYTNWRELRAHPDAQPEIQELAKLMIDAAASSTPVGRCGTDLMDVDAWHLPFVSDEERGILQVPHALGCSSARCARTSYLTHDQKNPVFEKDWGLYERLVESRPLHASPTEHQAFASEINRKSRNFDGGWLQHRELLERAGSIPDLSTLLSSPESYEAQSCLS